MRGRLPEKEPLSVPQWPGPRLAMNMMTAPLSLPGKIEASVPGPATGTTETILLVPGEILLVCRGKGRKKGKGGDTFLSLQVLMSSPALTILLPLQLTFVDFLTYDVLDQNRMFEPKCLDEFPNLKAFMCRFEVMDAASTFLLQKHSQAPPSSKGPHCGRFSPNTSVCLKGSMVGPGFCTLRVLSARRGGDRQLVSVAGLKWVCWPCWSLQGFVCSPSGFGEDRYLHAV